MDGLLYYDDNNTNCMNFSENLIKEYLGLRIFGIIGIPLLLVPSLILQFFFIYRYKSTLLHRQFLYTTVGCHTTECDLHYILEHCLCRLPFLLPTCE